MAFEDTLPNLIAGFQGQSWSNFKNKLDELLKDYPEEEEPPSTRLRTTRCVKFDIADAPIYGICPELEELVAVTCKVCSKIVKAEAIKSHYELSHSEAYKLVAKAVEDNCVSTTELKQLQGTLSSFAVKLITVVEPEKQLPPGKPSNFKIPVSKSKTKPKKSFGSPALSSPEPSPPAYPRLKSNSPPSNKFIPVSSSIPSPPPNQKNIVINETEKPKLEPVVSLVKVEVKGTPENDTPLSPPQLTPQVHVSSLASAPISPHPKISNQHKSTRSRPCNSSNSYISNNAISNVNSTLNSVAPCAIKIEELDLDRHCGVITDGVPCAQPLSCKNHSLVAKQNVKGRSRKFEVFLAEHVSAKESAKKKKDVKVVKATPDSTTSISNPLSPVIKTEVTSKAFVDANKKLSSTAVVVSPPPASNSASLFLNSIPIKKEEVEEKAVKSSSTEIVTPTNSYLQERSALPFFKASSLKHYEYLPRCYWPNRLARTLDTSFPLRYRSFMICYSLMHRTRRGMKNIRYYAKNYPSGSLRSKKCINPFTSLSRLIPKDIKPANSNHVKPLAVCSFNYQKCGGLLYSSRRVQLARNGLQNILMKTSAANNQTTSNTSTISNMLNSMSSKVSLTNRTVSNKKLPSRPVTNSQKSSFVSNSSTSLVKVPNFKSVLSQNSQKMAVKNMKNKQFHVPNILGNKRQCENVTKSNSNSKKAKKKPTRPTSDMNASQLINDFFSKNSSLKQRKSDSNVPVLRFAIANGRVEAAGEQKTVYSTSLIKDMKALKNESTTSSKPPVVGLQTTPVQQNSSSNENFGSQQITYLAASPVTFQQISLRMLNQLQLQGKSPNNSGNGTVKIVTNPSGGTLVKVPQSLLFQDKNSSA